MTTDGYAVYGVEGFPEVRPGDSLPDLIIRSVRHSRLGALAEGDIIVVASKIVSLWENCVIDLDKVIPSSEALSVGLQIGKDPRVVHLIMSESTTWRLATPKGPIIARHRLGWELTSAGVDAYSLAAAVVLPVAPDSSAERIRAALSSEFSVSQLGVIVADSDGRPDRRGSTVLAIGCAGFNPLRVTHTEVGGKLKKQTETLVDMIAAAGGVVLGQRGRGVPVVVVRGVHVEFGSGAMSVVAN